MDSLLVATETLYGQNHGQSGTAIRPGPCLLYVSLGDNSLKSSTTVEVMWVCNLCRKQQEILTKSGEWFSPGPRGRPLSLGAPVTVPEADGDRKLRSRSQAPAGNNLAAADTQAPATGPADRSKGADTMPASRARSEPPREKKRPVSLHEQNGKVIGRGERRVVPGRLPGQASEDRAPGERREGRRLEKGHSHEYNHPEGDAAHPDQRRRQEEEERERQRREEEYQTRYRSDPNLARYPVKPQKEEQEMRMHAKVSKMRQERHHSDLAINEVGLAQDGGEVPGGRLGRRVPSNEDRKVLLENHRAYSVDRTVGGGGGVGHAPLQKQGHNAPRIGPGAPPDLRDGPDWGPKDHLEPGSVALLHKTKREKAAESFRKDSSLSSDQSECLRPPPPRAYRPKRGLNKRQMSISSSEEEGGSTPEYTSCEDVEIESVSEKGDWDCHPLDPTIWHHPVTWQPSKEGDHLIGRITLSKRSAMPREAGSLLGLKVVGGKMTETGRLGAFITKVKKGSLADIVGHLRAAGSSSIDESQKMDRPSISVMSPTSPGMLRDLPQVLPGQLSVKLWYDKVGHQLIVNVLQARDLPPRPDGRPRNPYVKMYFLPDRGDKSKRRTKTVKKSSEPKWNQTFLYSHVHRRDFRERMLEITVWDQPRAQEEESEFLGEILIELETALLDDQSHWYKLQSHDVSSLPLPQPSPYLPRRHVHGDSPSKKLQRSHRIIETDYDDAITVVSSAAERNSRDRERSSTLTVPERQAAVQHRSRSVSPHREDQCRARSRPKNMPIQRSLDEIHQNRHHSHSPTLYHNSQQEHRSVDSDYDYSEDSDLQPALDRVRSASTTCLRPETSFHSPDRESIIKRIVAPTDRTQTAAKDCSGVVPDCHGVTQNGSGSSSVTSPAFVLVETTLAVEERARQLSQMRVPSYRPGSSASSGHDQEMELKNKRDMYKRSCDNMSARSSDSDVSDVSAISRASSASRLSSASYMSVQSERPHGRFRSKSLESCKGEEKKDRRISWGVSSPGQRRSLGKRRFSEELKRRRHTVAGDEDVRALLACLRSYLQCLDPVPAPDPLPPSISTLAAQASLTIMQLAEERPTSSLPLSPTSTPYHLSQENAVTGPTAEAFEEGLFGLSCSSLTPRQVRSSAGRNMLKSTSVSGEINTSERTDGSQSDTALGTVGSGSKKRRASLNARFVAIVGNRRSRSTSQISPTEASNKKSKGGGTTIQRSQETGMAVELQRNMSRQPSRESNNGSMTSYNSEGRARERKGAVCPIFPAVRVETQFSDFLDGLGPAQLVGRQTLATPSIGDIQIGMVNKKGQLEVEVIRARGLIQKPGSKSLPAPYVKVYLLHNGAYVAKKKTKIARKTLEPLYQQTLQFEESPQGKVLQVIVWGDYGRMDHKSFMGVAQILLEELDLASNVIG
ncbi:hypothetical protein NFI96_006936 [Prochilodus magdalenae]|nr:hypothetical protein NFI96_006936 [Prochilodus magdalenae]